jgi:hypothetical protein
MGFPYVLEAPVKALDGNLPHHSNLAREAYGGGELWFFAESEIAISGSSGRYPLTKEDQLDAVEAIFKCLNYETLSLGWDPETDSPHRALQPSILEEYEKRRWA